MPWIRQSLPPSNARYETSQIASAVWARARAVVTAGLFSSSYLEQAGWKSVCVACVQLNAGRQIAGSRSSKEGQKKSLGTRLKSRNVGVSTDQLISFEMALGQSQ